MSSIHLKNEVSEKLKILLVERALLHPEEKYFLNEIDNVLVLQNEFEMINDGRVFDKRFNLAKIAFSNSTYFSIKFNINLIFLDHFLYLKEDQKWDTNPMLEAHSYFKNEKEFFKFFDEFMRHV